MEEILIRKIEAFIRGIRLGTKNPKDVATELSSSFKRLNSLNEGMYEELMGKYKNVLSDYKKRNNLES